MEGPVEAPPQAQAARRANGVNSIRLPSNPRMIITPAERSCALAIKAAIEGDPELDSISDFWYAQLAIVNKDDMETTKRQARNMQYFREEYDIRDDMEDAKRSIWEFIHLFDNWILTFSYSKENLNYLWAVDIAAIDNQTLLQSDKAWRTNLAGHYYMRQALNPDLVAISQGINIMHECGGFDFSGKFGGLGHVTRLAQEVFANYPCLHDCLLWFNTGKC